MSTEGILFIHTNPTLMCYFSGPRSNWPVLFYFIFYFASFPALPGTYGGLYIVKQLRNALTHSRRSASSNVRNTHPYVGTAGLMWIGAYLPDLSQGSLTH